MATEVLELQLRVTGGSTAASSFAGVSKGAKDAATSVNSLAASFRLMRNTLVAFSFLRIFEGLASGISQVQAINNQLLQISKTAADVPKAFAMFSNIALATHAPLESVVALGATLARSSASAKMSSTEISMAIQTIFNTFRLSGSDPSTIRNVTKDLQEIFSLGAVQGRQFRAVVLQDQVLAIDLGKYMHATGVGAAAVNAEMDKMRAKGVDPNMREMSMKNMGAFTGADFAQAAVDSFQDTQKKVADLPTTLGQAFTDLQTQMYIFTNTLQNGGVFKPIVQFVEFLGQNLPLVITSILAFGAAWGSWIAIRSVGLALLSVAAGINFIGLSLIKNTLFMVGYLTAFSVWVATSLTGYVAVGAAATAEAATATVGFLSMIGGAIAAAAAFEATDVALAGTVVAASLAFATISASVVAALPFIVAFAAVFGGLGVAIYGAAVGVAAFFAPMGALGGLISGFDQLHLTIKDFPAIFSGLMDTLTNSWPLVMAVMTDTFTDMMNNMENKLGEFGNNIFKTAVGARSAITGLPVPAGVAAAAAAGGFQTDRPVNFNGGTTHDISVLRQTLATNILRQKTIAGNPVFVPPQQTGQPDAAGKDFTDKRLNALQELENSLSRFAGPAAKFQDDMDKVTTHIKEWTTATKDAKGNPIAPLLTQSQVAAEFAAVGFGDYSAATHTSVLYTQAAEREVLGLKNANIDFLNTQKLVNKAVADGAINQDTANKLMDAAGIKRADAVEGSGPDAYAAALQSASLTRSQLLGNAEPIGKASIISAGAAQDAAAKFLIQQKALNDAVGVSITQQQADLQIRKDALVALNLQTDAMSGYERALLDLQDKFSNTAADVSAVFTTAFEDISTGLASLLQGGTFNLSKFATDVESGVATAASHAILAPILNSITSQPGFLGTLGSIAGSSLGMKPDGSSAALALWVQNAYDPTVPGSLGGALTGASSSGGSITSFLTDLLSGNGGGAGSLSSSILSTLGLQSVTGSVSDAAASALSSSSSSIFAATESSLPGLTGAFATGGSFTVGGSGATDSQLTAFMATPGENVSVGQDNGGGTQVIVNDMRTASGSQPVQVQSRVGSGGQRQLEILITDTVNNAIANGKTDTAMGQSYGISRVGKQR